MYYCLNENTQQILTVEKYQELTLLDMEPISTTCLYCHKKVFLKAPISIRKTHFSHYPNNSCNNINFNDIYNLSSSNRKSKTEINLLIHDIILNSFDIYSRMIELEPSLSIEEYLSLLDKLYKSKALFLVGTTPAIIPYICLHLRGKYNTSFYILTFEEVPTTSLWSLSPSKNVLKKYDLDCEDRITTITSIPLSTDYIDNSHTIPFDFLNTTFNSLVNIFNIKNTLEDNLLKDLINKIANTT